MANNYLEENCISCNLKNLIKQLFQKSRKSNHLYLILTNLPKSFHLSGVYETVLPAFHKLTLTVLKVFYAKHKPKII